MAKKSKFTLEGTRNISANINKEILLMKGKSLAGLISASIIVRRKMAFTPPLVPVDTRNLDHSWFVTTAKSIEDGKSPAFKGEKSGELASEHSQVTSNEKANMMAIKIPMLTMGFSANYAIYVHERVGDDIKYRKPGSGAKFFQSALEGSKGEILQTIKEHAKIR